MYYVCAGCTFEGTLTPECGGIQEAGPLMGPKGRDLMNRTIVMYRTHPRIHPCTTHHVGTQQEAALHEPGTGSPSDTESASPQP